jgi:hypothetical protein
MMTLDELQAATINPAVAQEAYAQSSQRLAEILETKRSFDQKAFTLFTGYLSVCVAQMAIAASFHRDRGSFATVLAFSASGLILAAGAILFAMAQRPADYGALGSAPEAWLRPGVIDGGESALPATLAYMTHYHRSQMTLSIACNEKKAKLILWGIRMGIAAPIAMGGMLLMSFIFGL